MLKLLIPLLLFVTVSANDLVLTGTVISNGQKFIGSRYMGYIKKVFVKLGDKVKREDDLYEMESAEFDIMKSQAELSLEQSKIVVEFWRKRLANIDKRRKRVQDRISTSKKASKSTKKEMWDDLDSLDSMAENVSGMLDAAQLVVKQASIKAKQMATMYNYVKMKAPSDGTIVQKHIKPGDMIMPGMLAIVMVDSEDLEIDVSISESMIKHVHDGKIVEVKIPAVDYTTIGVIKAIIPDANPMTHKITMRVTFDKKDSEVFPGMYAKIFIKK
ncbi:MAG: efflux RND transporter periplasmic adaptor subunit [Campylobacterota bacterium]|nr:efflux RND transporter periplasmic adaptor subunit [Campylobacterota bacterium]